MSFSGLLTSVAEYVGETLVDDCGRPPPTRVLRYHGTAGLPWDCCTDDGILSVGWDQEFVSDPFPSQWRGSSDGPGVMAAALTVRYVVCWTAPEVNGTTGRLVLTDAVYDRFDATTAMLAEVADCVGRALLRLNCAAPTSDVQLDVLAASGCNRFAYQNVVPTGPQGSCAGLLWRAYAGVVPGGSLS